MGECYYYEYKTNNFILSAVLEAGNAFADTNCQKQGQDFLDTPSKTATCSGSQTLCYKSFVTYDQMVFADEVAVQLYARGCVENNYQSADADASGCLRGDGLLKIWTEGSQTNKGGVSCGCNTDLCNSSSRAIISGLVMIVGVVMAMLL